jgi:hypothetical protein
VFSFGVIDEADVAAAETLLQPGGRDDHGQLSIQTQAAVRCRARHGQGAGDGFKDGLNRFIRFFAFLGQDIDYIPPETDALFLFSNYYSGRVPSEAPEGGLSLAVE